MKKKSCNKGLNTSIDYNAILLDVYFQAVLSTSPTKISSSPELLQLDDQLAASTNPLALK